jgi:hypothetical protein
MMMTITRIDGTLPPVILCGLCHSPRQDILYSGGE